MPAMSAALYRNRRTSVIAELLACAPANDVLGLGPAFVRAQPAGIVADELPTAQLASVAPGMLRIDIPDWLNRLQAIEHRRSFLTGSRTYETTFPMSGDELGLEPFRSRDRCRVSPGKPMSCARAFYKACKNSIVFMSLRHPFADLRRRRRYRDVACSAREFLPSARFRPASCADRRSRRFPPARKMHRHRNP